MAVIMRFSRPNFAVPLPSRNPHYRMIAVHPTRLDVRTASTVHSSCWHCQCRTPFESVIDTISGGGYGLITTRHHLGLYIRELYCVKSNHNLASAIFSCVLVPFVVALSSNTLSVLLVLNRTVYGFTPVLIFVILVLVLASVLQTALGVF